MSAAAARTASHLYMRPVVRPVPQPSAIVAASATW
jgi:hypothetical protein